MGGNRTLAGLTALVVTTGTASVAMTNATSGPLAIAMQAPGIAVWALHFHRTSRLSVRVVWTALMWVAIFVGCAPWQRPIEASLTVATSLCAGAIVGYCVLSRDCHEAPSLQNGDDLLRLTQSFLASLLTTAAVAFVGLGISGDGSPWVGAVALAGLQGLSFGLAIPMICLTLPHRRRIRIWWHVAHWVGLTALATVLFGSTHGDSLIYLLIPFVGYAALRFPLKEAVAQLWVMVAIAIIMFTGLIPGMDESPINFSIPLPEDLRLLPICLLAVVCQFIIVVANVMSTMALHLRDELRQKSEQLQDTLATATGAALIETDSCGNIVMFSRGAELMTGWGQAEVMGQSPAMFFSDESLRDITQRAGLDEPNADLGHIDRYNRIAFQIALRAVQSTAKANDWAFTHRDGRVRWASTFITPKLDDNGQLIGFVGTCEDITRRVIAEHSLTKALDKEREAVAQLAELDKVKDQFVSTVSHELRTPITNIIGNTELLEEGDLGEISDAQRSAIQRISFSGKRLLALINDLLTLSRVQQIGLEKNVARFDLRDVVRAASIAAEPAGRPSKHADLVLALPTRPVPYDGDSDKLERAIVNLISNAIKFTPADGNITVELVGDHASYQIKVSDNGRGISEQEQERLFTRFFRADSADRDAIPGSGLGLSIVRTIVELHEGSVSVDSLPGEGSTFTITLPTQPTAASRERTTPPAQRNVS